MGRRKLTEIEKADLTVSRGLDSLYNAVCAKVKEIQERNGKGYVRTDDPALDRIWFYDYADGESDTLYEGRVFGIKTETYPNGTMGLLILGTVCNITFCDNDFDIATDNYTKDKETDNIELCWQHIRYHETIMFVPTLLSIAEAVEEYDR